MRPVPAAGSNALDTRMLPDVICTGAKACGNPDCPHGVEHEQTIHCETRCETMDDERILCAEKILTEVVDITNERGENGNRDEGV
jgi:hypothetical protein